MPQDSGSVIVNNYLNIQSNDRTGDPDTRALSVNGNTFTDNITSGTNPLWSHVSIDASILAATNPATTTTDAATLIISGPPVAGTNMTITNAYAISATGDVRVVGDVTSTGDMYATSFNATSDKRLKSNIKPLYTGLDVMSKMETYSYEWKNPEAPSGSHWGIMAQDMDDIGLGHLVAHHKNGELAVNYLGMIPLMINSIKQLNKKIQTLQI